MITATQELTRIDIRSETPTSPQGTLRPIHRSHQISGNALSGTPGQTPSAWVECYQATGSDSKFAVEVESDHKLEVLNLPEVERVDICQQFEAETGDQLSLDFVTVQMSAAGPDNQSARIEAKLTNLTTLETEKLLVHQLNRANRPTRSGSQEMESVSHTIREPGLYELRFVQDLSEMEDSTRSQLWVDSAKVVSGDGHSCIELSSIGSCGRVR